MKEYFTEAIVLGMRAQGEYDRLVDLYTKELGRLEAKVVSGRRIKSKLSPHFVLGGKVSARLAYKNQFTVTDVLGERSFLARAGTDSKTRILGLLFLVRSLVPFSAPDLNMWHRLTQSLESGRVDYKVFLKILGYDVMLAKCDGCGKLAPRGFYVTSQVFACGLCLRKLPQSELIFI